MTLVPTSKISPAVAFSSSSYACSAALNIVRLQEIESSELARHFVSPTTILLLTLMVNVNLLGFFLRRVPSLPFMDGSPTLWVAVERS